MNQTFNHEGFNCYDHKTPLRREKILILCLSLPEDPEIEKELVDFRGREVKAFINIEKETDKKHSIEDTFTFWMSTKKIKSGNILEITLTAPYDKVLEKKIVDVKYHNVELTMKMIEQELSFDEDEE